MGAWSNSFADCKPKYCSGRNGVSKARTSGESLPIDINFVSICSRSAEESCQN